MCPKYPPDLLRSKPKTEKTGLFKQPAWRADTGGMGRQAGFVQLDVGPEVTRAHAPPVSLARPATAWCSWDMPQVIHLRCERCGGPTDGRQAWVRCGSCGTTAGFNFTQWTESPAFLEFQRRAMLDPQGYQKRWSDHSAELDRAARLFAADPVTAMNIAAEQAGFLLAETSWVFPPHALADAQTRAAYRRWLGFELLHQRLGGPIAALYADLNRATAAIGFGANENPLPAFARVMEIMGRLLAARAELGSPPDPEGLSPETRLRVQASVMVGAYLRLVSPELQHQLLRAIYGDRAVAEAAPVGQDYSLYFDWQCPQCGLFSPQAVGTDKMTCPGCYCARPFEGEAMSTGPISAICHGCGSGLRIAEREMMAVCGFCTSQVQRFVRAGDAHRSLVAEMKARIAAQYGFDPAESLKPSDGFGVTPGNRNDRLRDGLVRIAQWYHKFLTPTRYLGFARASLGPDTAAVADLLRQTEARAASENSPDGALALIRKARERMA